MSALEPIAPRVRRLPVRTPTLPPATHTNTYVLGADALTVVDPASPYPDEQGRLAEALEADGGRVVRILLTHHHHDHVGGAVALQRAWAERGRAVPIVAHARTAVLLDGELTVDAFLADGDVLDVDGHGLAVLHTPGHASDHVVLHDEETGVMVAGDMVAGVGTVVIPPGDGDLGEYLHALARMQRRSPRVLLPSHGDPLEPATAVLGFYVAHRHQRTDQIRRALTRGAASAIELVRPVYGDTIPPETHWLAAVQIHAHLDWMLAQGLVRRGEGERWEAA